MPTTTLPASRNRGAGLLAPSVAAGMALWVAYTVVTVAVQLSAGVPYIDWFSTAAHAWRVGVASLVAGALLLLVCLAIARWDHLWRDPVRLASTRPMRAAMLLWWLAIGVRLVGVRWADVPPSLLAAMVASGVLVGFAEETLFRGFFLRALRAGGRAEGRAALWVAVCFGLFHLPNVFMGMGALGLLQVLLAATSGAVLYAFRRHFGLLWPAMVAHGAWDISTFLAINYGQPWLPMVSLGMQPLVALLGIAILVGLARHDRAAVLP